MSEPVKLTKVFDADDQNITQHKPNVGQQLAQARLQQLLTLEQVASQLKWSVRQMRDIEASNYAAFPDMLSVRGIVKTYAKLLKLESTSLLEELPRELEQPPSKTIDRPPLDMPFPNKGMQWRNGGNPFKSSGLILLLVLYLVVVFVYRDKLARLGQSVLPAANESKPLAVDVSPVSQPALSEPNDTTSDLLPTRKVESVPSASVKASPPLIAPTTSSAATTSEATSPPAAGAWATSPETQKSLKISDKIEAAPSKADSSAITATSPNALVLHFRQDSWLQVRHADGSVVISRRFKAGSEQLIDVNEPLSMVVGNGPGVDASLRGQTLDLPAAPGSNVVNLTVR